MELVDTMKLGSVIEVILIYSQDFLSKDCSPSPLVLIEHNQRSNGEWSTRFMESTLAELRFQVTHTVV